MSIQAKLTKLKQSSDHEINVQEELNRYFNQDKVKQLLLESKDLEDVQVIIESNEHYQVTLSKCQIELYTSELELIYMRDIRIVDRIGKQSVRLVKTWSSESAFTVSLKDDEVKVECHEPIKNVDEVIENLENLLFS